MRITLPQLAWHGTRALDLDVPDDWDVSVRETGGHRRPPLTAEQIAGFVRRPVGIAPLNELARGRREVAILFDDLTRVTRPGPIAEAIVEELARAGIRDNQIRFVMALGTHGAANRTDFEKKLGRALLRRFPVYNHNPFLPGVYVGTTATFGTPVYLNEEVARCDLRIGISSVVCHGWAGFGGGGKIILPGVCAVQTIVHNHRAFHREAASDRHPPRVGLGVWSENPMLRDIMEAASLAGLEVSANAVVNGWGDTAALYVGSLMDAHAAASQDASRSCRTEKAINADIVIANSFAKASEGFLGVPTAYESIRPEGGDVVLVDNSPDGQVTHYLSSPFGEFIAGPEWKDPTPVPDNVDRLIVFNEYPDLAARRWYENSPKVYFCERWGEVLDLLLQKRGPGSRVAVYPSADIQYLHDPAQA